MRTTFIISACLTLLTAAAAAETKGCGGFTAPRILSRAAPVYTQEARDVRFSGIAVIDTRIRADGTVERATIAKDLPYRLGPAAQTAVEQWIFEPATCDGAAVPVEFSFAIRFADPATTSWMSATSRAPMTKEVSIVSSSSHWATKCSHMVHPVAPSPVEPIYTSEAKKAGIGGIVLLNAFIRADGSVERVETLKDLPLGLGDAAKTAVERWAFKPATCDGMGIPVELVLTIRFAPLAAEHDLHGRNEHH